MGAKTKVQNVSTQTPLQQALMNYQLKSVMDMLKGMPNLGESWGGAKTNPAGPAAPTASRTSVPSAAPPMGQTDRETNPLARILGEFSLHSRDRYTNPFTNPFRNNMQ